MWNALLGAVTAEDKLEAAWTEIRAEQREALEGREPNLTLDRRIDVTGERLEITVGTTTHPAARVFSIDLSLIQLAARKHYSPLRLVAARMIDEMRDRPLDDLPEIGRSNRPGRDELATPDQTADRLYQSLEQRPDVVLVGVRGTRKTASAASLAYRLEEEGHGCIWVDLRDGRAVAETVAWELLRLRRHDDVLVVVNQVQDHISEVGPVLKFTSVLRAHFQPTRVLATGSPAIVNSHRPFQSFERVPARTPDHLPREKADREALYWFACLKLLDIRPPIAIVLRTFPQDLISRLSTGPDAYLSLNSAHCSLASRRDAAQLARELRGSTTPGDVIWNYLKLIGPSAAGDLLYRLDRGDVGGAAADGGSYLRPAWELLYGLGRTLDDHCGRDPSWGENVGAAVFAAEALAELGHHRQWELVARFVRGRWRYDRPGVLPAPADRPTSEFADFDEIARCMAIEDAYLSLPDLGIHPGRGHDDRDSIDFDRFHRTWMLGVLLGFEGTALHKAPELTAALIETAEANCDPEDGHFYPRRVPWVTARVVLGLCRADQNYQNSDIVRRACEWLKRPLNRGGPYGGWWKGGTGSWNRDEATTAMCVAALIRAGDGDAPEVHTALAWLRARVGEWTKTDREIDLALVLEATLLGAADWRSSYARILNLLSWAAREIQRKTVHEPEPRFVPENALRAPFAAAQLAVLVRVAVGRESEALLGQSASRPVPRQRAAGSAYVPGQSLAPGEELYDARPLPSLQRWRRAGDAVAETLENRIADRSAVLEFDNRRRASEIWQQVEHDRQRLNRCRELIDRLQPRTPPDVLEELIELGRDVRGVAWDDGLSFER